MDPSFTDLLPAFLAGRDVGCPGCGYNLRDLRQPRCPECGQAIALRVGLAEPRQAALIAGLLGLAAGAGMSGLLVGFGLIRMLFFGDRPGGMGAFYGLTLGGVVVEGAALVGWLRHWRRIRRLPRSIKLLLVSGCWALTLLNLLLFAAFVK